MLQLASLMFRVVAVVAAKVAVMVKAEVAAVTTRGAAGLEAVLAATTNQVWESLD